MWQGEMTFGYREHYTPKAAPKVCVTVRSCISSCCTGCEGVLQHKLMPSSDFLLWQGIWTYGIPDFPCLLESRTSVPRGGIQLPVWVCKSDMGWKYSLLSSQMLWILHQMTIIRMVFATLVSRQVLRQRQWDFSLPKPHSMNMRQLLSLYLNSLFPG